MLVVCRLRAPSNHQDPVSCKRWSSSKAKPWRRRNRAYSPNLLAPPACRRVDANPCQNKRTAHLIPWQPRPFGTSPGSGWASAASQSCRYNVETLFEECSPNSIQTVPEKRGMLVTACPGAGWTNSEPTPEAEKLRSRSALLLSYRCSVNQCNHLGDRKVREDGPASINCQLLRPADDGQPCSCVWRPLTT